MRRGQWLPVIDLITDISEGWPFELLPLKENEVFFVGKSGWRRTRMRSTSNKFSHDTMNCRLEILIRRNRGEHDREGDVIVGEYINVSSEDYIVVSNRYVGDKWKDPTSVSVSESVKFIPWEEIVFIGLICNGDRLK